nr:DUF1654 domain-containing protein [uncultured Pseudomonas sp.]
MAKQKKSAPQERQVMSGMERLSLRVSSMINHPIAQSLRWVTIHRLDTDGEREWDELLSVLSDTDGIEMTINDEDDSITLRWEAASDDDRVVEVDDVEVAEEPAPF